MKLLVNIVTVSRVFVACVFYVLVVVLHIDTFFLLISCFVLIESSDLLDGWFARKTKSVSDLGKLLDPVCDVSAHFICIFALEKVGFAPSIVLIIFILREVWVQLLRTVLVKHNVVFAARISGKIKTWVYGIAICLSIFIFPQAPFSAWTFMLMPLVRGLFYVAAAISIFSGIQYAIIGMNIMKKNKNTIHKDITKGAQ